MPISRRQALPILAGALTMPLHAATSRSEISFLVITDTHLGYTRDVAKAETLWKSTSAQLAEEPGAFVLHLGDVVDGGQTDQYANYLAGRAVIGKPVHEVPGNHDPVDGFQKHLRQQIDHVVEHEWLRILLLNNAHRDSHEGFLEPAQLTWLSEQCDQAAAKDQVILFAMHVPVHPNLHPDRGWYVKPEHGQKEFYALLDKHKARTLAVFHGHFHNGLRGWDDRAPVHEVSFPSALWNQDRQLESQGAPGYNPLEFRPGFTRVKAGNGTLALEYQPLGEPVVVKKAWPVL